MSCSVLCPRYLPHRVWGDHRSLSPRHDDQSPQHASYPTSCQWHCLYPPLDHDWLRTCSTHLEVCTHGRPSCLPQPCNLPHACILIQASPRLEITSYLGRALWIDASSLPYSPQSVIVETKGFFRFFRLCPFHPLLDFPGLPHASSIMRYQVTPRLSNETAWLSTISSLIDLI